MGESSIESVRKVYVLNDHDCAVAEEDLKEYFETSYGIFRGKVTRVARLRFTPARSVAKETWHAQQRGTFEKDSSYMQELPYHDDRELVMEVLRHGAEVGVMRPKKLKTVTEKTLPTAFAKYNAYISPAADQHFPKFQHDYAPLAERLSGLGLAGGDRARALNQEIADVLFTDASDAPQRMGAETSVLYESLKWATEVKRVLDNGLDDTLRELQAHRRDIEALPDTGVPGDLRHDVEEGLAQFVARIKQDDFFQHVTEFSTQLTDIKARVRDAAIKVAEQQTVRVKESVEDLQRLPDWEGMTQEERGNVMTRLDGLIFTASHDLDGLRRLLARDFDINTTIDGLKRSIQREGQERRRLAVEEERKKFGGGPSKLSKEVRLPKKVASTEGLEQIIRDLYSLKVQGAHYAEIDVSFVIDGD